MDQIEPETKSVPIPIESAEEESGKQRCCLMEHMEEKQIPGVTVAGQRRTSETPVIRVSSTVSSTAASDS